MKKKILCFLGTLFLVCACMFSFVACGGQEPLHEHAFNQEVVNDAYKASNATCTQKPGYYYSCVCGEKGVEVFESGSALGHSYGSCVNNGNGTHTKTCDNDSNHKVTENCGWEYVSNNDGTKGATCECGSKDVVVDENVFVIVNKELVGVTEYGKSLRELVIPNSVTSIKAGALKECSLLEEITLPFIGAGGIASRDYEKVFGYVFGYIVKNSSTEVNGAVWQCIDSLSYYHYYIPTTLRVVNILEGATIVPRNAFYGCDFLTAINLPETVERIEKESFSLCSGLLEMDVPNSVVFIGDSAFSSCSGLAEITLGNNVEEIGSNAFSNCSNITEFIVPSKVVSMGSNVFSNCLKLTKIVFEDAEGWCSTTNYNDWCTKTNGVQKDVTDSSKNVNEFLYHSRYWYKEQ